MACTISFSFLTESLTGNIGDDWKYGLSAKVFGAGARSHALISQGELVVPEHLLSPETTQSAPDNIEPLALSAGDAGRDIKVELRFTAVEVDAVQNDTGEVTTSFKARCPAEGANPVVMEREISLGIEEAPSGIGTAVLTLTYKVVISSG